MMAYTRIDPMDGFFEDAKDCMTHSSVEEIGRCLREDARALCESPRASNRGTPRPVAVSTGDLRDGSSSFELGDAEERTLRLTPQAKVKLSLFSQGDARMNVSRAGAPVVADAAEATLEAGVAHDITIRTCNGEQQMLSLVWQPQD